MAWRGVTEGFGNIFYRKRDSMDDVSMGRGGSRGDLSTSSSSGEGQSIDSFTLNQNISSPMASRC